jgi:hypothetical protein
VSRSSTPHWHEPGDVVRTIRTAQRKRGVDTDRVVEVLANHELDAPRARIEKLVEATPTDLGSDGTDVEELAEPRADRARFVDSKDVEYLSTDEFATVLGAALSRYRGQFRTPEEVDELDVDLFWNRQHTTVALRTVPRDPGEHVEEDVVQHVVRGNTSNPSGRTPSTVGVVTNTGFTDAAAIRAEEGDLELFGAEALAQWLRDARLTPEVVGELLDEGERSDAEFEALLEELPPLPEPVADRDPLSGVDSGTGLHSSIDTADRNERGAGARDRSVPVVDTPSTPGQRGELYADPEEDGDFGAFDDYMDELDADENSE